jgi:nicotinate-nucleotide adenylyltransferase
MGVTNDHAVTSSPRPCILLLGGSFDPVHHGHVALAKLFSEIFQPDQLRIIPSGNPWQKSGLIASAAQRLDMLHLAFQGQMSVPVLFDTQEIERARQHQASYTIDTLRNLRSVYGSDACLIFLIGADQLANLQSWHAWQQLFDYAHICAASRPGITLGDNLALKEFQRRSQSAATIREHASGYCLLTQDLEIDISATQIRAELKQGTYNTTLVPELVLDYIQQHQLYSIHTSNGY